MHRRDWLKLTGAVAAASAIPLQRLEGFQAGAPSAGPARVETEVVRLRLRHTWTTTMSSSEYRDTLHVRYTRDGVTGIGEGAPIVRYHEDAASAKRAVDVLASFLAAADPRAFDKLMAEVLRRVEGEWAAKAAVDIAVLDWVGQRLGIPVKTFKALNPDVNSIAHKVRISKDNIIDIIKDYDIVVAGSDNFPTRYLVNDACVMAKKPLVSGAILKFEGQVTTIIPGEGHYYRCLFEEPPPAGLVPSCQEAGVLGVLTGVVGSLQATEVLKLILGKGDPLKNSLLIYDALRTTFRKVKVPKNPNCAICGDNPTITELIDYNEGYCSLP